MKTIKQKLYRVQYSAECSTDSILVEADSIIEAMEVAKSHLNYLKDIEIEGVQSYTIVIKKIN